MSKHKILTLVVAYNEERCIDKCVKSVLDSKHPTDALFINNNSSDRTKEILDLKKGIKVIHLEQNLGFTGGNNVGIEYALENDYDFVFLLNADAYLHENAIEEQFKAWSKAENPGIMASLQLNGKGTAIDERFESYIGGKNCPNLLGDVLLDKLNDFYLCGFVNAAAWFVPIKTIKTVGFLDPLFFIYGEDANYLQRTRFMGMKIYLVPKSIVYHDRESRKGSLNFKSNKHEINTEFLKNALNIKLGFRRMFRNQLMYSLHLIKKGQPIYCLMGILTLLVKGPKILQHRKLYKLGFTDFK
jgi:GT2 family glycosyltransferase